MATRIDRFVTRTPDAVPAPPPPVVPPNCTCFLASGTVIAGRLSGVRQAAQGHRDPKGRPICQVHFPVDQAEYETRCLGGLDNFPRK